MPTITVLAATKMIWTERNYDHSNSEVENLITFWFTFAATVFQPTNFSKHFFKFQQGSNDAMSLRSAVETASAFQAHGSAMGWLTARTRAMKTNR